MSLELLLFFLFAAIALLGAVSLILLRHPIHSALALIVVMVALAALYLLLGAEFIAAVQMIVYAGAIMVLFVFVIMLLNAGEEEHTDLSRITRYVGLPVATALLAEMGWLLYRAWPGDLGVEPDRLVGRTSAVGHMLFREYVLPFELTSVVILIAIIGAIVLAKKER